VSVFTGVVGPLLWMVAVTVTLNAVPVFALAGADTDTAFTFTSAVPATIALPHFRCCVGDPGNCS